MCIYNDFDKRNATLSSKLMVNNHVLLKPNHLLYLSLLLLKSIKGTARLDVIGRTDCYYNNKCLLSVVFAKFPGLTPS